MSEIPDQADLAAGNKEGPGSEELAEVIHVDFGGEIDREIDSGIEEQLKDFADDENVKAWVRFAQGVRNTADSWRQEIKVVTGTALSIGSFSQVSDALSRNDNKEALLWALGAVATASVGLHGFKTADAAKQQGKWEKMGILPAEDSGTDKAVEPGKDGSEQSGDGEEKIA